MEFRTGESDQCLYTKGEQENLIYLLIYVDDILIACKNVSTIEETAEILKNHFKMTCMGNIEDYLGIQVRRDEDGIYSINQKKYIDKLFNEFKMENSNGVSLPFDIGYYKNRALKQEKFNNEEINRSAIGALLYLSVNTVPDICVDTSTLGRHVSDLYTYDWSDVKRIMKYLNGTIDMEIKLGDIRYKDENVRYGYADMRTGHEIDRTGNRIVATCSNTWVQCLIGAAKNKHMWH